MAGVPYHSVEGYIRRMIQAGRRVAVCDQMEKPSSATKGIVKRQVTRVITPGTVTDESLLDEAAENPLAAVAIVDDRACLAWAELSTGTFRVMDVPRVDLADELARLAPGELLYPESDGPGDTTGGSVIQQWVEQTGCPPVTRPVWQFRQTQAVETICRQFAVATVEGFGFNPDDPVLGPASAILHYLLETQAPAPPGSTPVPTDQTTSGQEVTERHIPHLSPPRRIDRADHLVIDQTTLRSLEVERTIRSGEVAGSLLGVLQGCVTAMGKRTLRHWLCYPLCQRGPIEKRQQIVSAMTDDERLRDNLAKVFHKVQDVQRISARVAVGRATPRDLVGLGTSIDAAGTLGHLLADRPAFADYTTELCGTNQSTADRFGSRCDSSLH